MSGKYIDFLMPAPVPPPAAPDSGGASYRRSVLIMAMSTAFINPFVGSAVNVALPAIAKDFTADAVMISWVAMSYLLASAAFMVPFGRLADICGRKKIYLTGIFLFTLSSVFCASCDSIGSLIFFRTFQGVSSAMIFSTSMAILMSAYPDAGRGKALGLTVASTYTGLSAGPFIGGLITQYSSWRGIFWFSFAVSLYGAVLIAQPLMMAVFSPIVGRLSEKIEPAFLASAGMGLTGLGLFFFVPISADTSILMIVLNLGLVTK